MDRLWGTFELMTVAWHHHWSSAACPWLVVATSCTANARQRWLLYSLAASGAFARTSPRGGVALLGASGWQLSCGRVVVYKKCICCVWLKLTDTLQRREKALQSRGHSSGRLRE